MYLTFAVGSRGAGKFFTVIDLHTPFAAVYVFYDNLISPYKELILSKFNELTDVNLENIFINKSMVKSNISLPLLPPR